MNFEGKSVFFIGDSITATGAFIKPLRSYFKNTKRNIFLHNKGIPGGTAVLANAALDEELDGFCPDIAIISLGANDSWYWAYNSAPKMSASELDERRERRRIYVENIRLLCQRLIARGVTPILCSPFCVNKFQESGGNIDTVVDSKEKGAITDSFYNSVTFGRINDALREFCESVREYASEAGIELFDMYEATYALTDAECFNADGIHYSRKGNDLIAALLLKYMLGEELKLYDRTDAEYERIAALEFDERAYYFVKYNIMRGRCNGLPIEEFKKQVREWLLLNGNTEGLTKAREESFFRVVADSRGKQRELIDIIRSKKYF